MVLNSTKEWSSSGAQPSLARVLHLEPSVGGLGPDLPRLAYIGSDRRYLSKIDEFLLF